jgi:HK97 family phage major capsid protein
MSRLQALREKKVALATQLKAEADRLGADGYAATPEEDAAFDALTAEHAAVCKQLDRLESAEAAVAAAERVNAGPTVMVVKDGRESGGQDKPRVAATPRRHAPLRAFKTLGVEAAERAGMFFAASVYGDAGAARWCADRGITTAPSAVLNTTDNAKGGYFVPDEIEYAVQELALQFGVFRQYAAVEPMGSGTKESPRWTAGMTAYWTSEGSSPTQSDPAWDLITLVARELKAWTKLTRVIDEDSAVNLGEKITMAMAEAFAYAEDYAGFNGDGTSTYGGIEGLVTKILASSAAYDDAATGNVSDVTLDLDDFNACVAKLPNWPNFNPVWFMHKTVWANSAQRLQMALGGIVPADVQMGAQPMLLGYPVVFVNAMDPTPTISEIAAILGDLRWSSKVGDRRGLTVERGLDGNDFSKGLISVLGTKRVAINNHTITDPRSSSLTGPVVGLKLAAS